MFIINPYLRIALIVAGIGLGVGLWVAFGFWYGFPFWLSGLILLVGFVLMGTVGSAAQATQTMNFDKADKLLRLTFFPKLLYPTNRAYFYMLKGTIAMSRNDMEAGEHWLKKAETIDLPTDNDRAMLQLQLAGAALNRGRFKQAEIHYRNAKDLKITIAEIKEQLKQIEKAIQSQGQMKAAMRMGRPGGGGMQVAPGGKRRRPKMR